MSRPEVGLQPNIFPGSSFQSSRKKPFCNAPGDSHTGHHHGEGKPTNVDDLTPRLTVMVKPKIIFSYLLVLVTNTKEVTPSKSSQIPWCKLTSRCVAPPWEVKTTPYSIGLGSERKFHPLTLLAIREGSPGTLSITINFAPQIGISINRGNIYFPIIVY